MSYRIILEKENFKFSGSHFTIFSATSGERLHGHNYYMTVSIGVAAVDENLGLAFDFNLFKPMIRDIAQSLDEYVLLPAHSQHLKLEEKPSSIRATFNQKFYEFPKEDVRVLPVTNVTAEELARFISCALITRAKSECPEIFENLTTLSIGVEESRGQSVFYDAILQTPAQPEAVT